MTRAISSLKEDDLKTILDELERVAKPRVLALHKKIKTGRLEGTDAWYQSSYAVFTTGSRCDCADFIRVIAYAYSWLATIPKAHPVRADFSKFSKAQVACARAVASGKSSNAVRARLIRASQKALGITGKGSVVAVSKVLHFWDPTAAPMIDQYSRDALAILHIDRKASYVEYWKLADQLIAYAATKNHSLGKLTYRGLDELLFQLGKGVRVKKSKAGARAQAKKHGTVAAKSGRTVGRKVTKMERARQLIVARHGAEPKEIIRELVDKVGLTPQGASTYYYKLISERRRSGE